MKKSLLPSGQTIIEVLIATALIAFSILAAMSLNSNTQKTSSYARDLNSATTYNNQVVDWLRNLRTTMGWGSLTNELTLDSFASSVTYCLNSLPTTPTEFSNLENNPCAGDDYLPNTLFSRQAVFDLSSLASNSLKVTITTSWESNILNSTSTETTLTNW